MAYQIKSLVTTDLSLFQKCSKILKNHINLNMKKFHLIINNQMEKLNTVSKLQKIS